LTGYDEEYNYEKRGIKMPVFDFSDTPVANEHPECTYETFHSTETKASADKPIVVIDNKQKEWAHHALGMFTNPIKRTSFEFEDGDGVTSADILRIDSRFVSLFKWLGENHIKVQIIEVRFILRHGAGKEPFHHILQESVLCRQLCASAETPPSLTPVYCVSVRCIGS